MILYSYNGMTAPALPQWKEALYPHAYMAQNAVVQNAYALYVSDKPFIYDAEKSVTVPTDGATVMRATCYNNKWSEFTNEESKELLVARWCNISISSSDGSVFLEASKPVAYGEPIVVTHEVAIDVMHMDVPEMLHAVQSDQYSRNIKFTLFANGSELTIPPDTKITISCSKKDGTNCNYDTMPDGSAAADISGNTVTVKLAPQVLTVVGKVMLNIAMDSGGTKLHTFSLMIMVQANPGLQVVSSNYFKISGTVADSGWTPNKYLGTDADGKVVEKDAPTGSGESNPVKSIAITEGVDGSVTMVNTLDDGTTETIVISPDESGNPNKLTYNGKEIPISWVVSE